MAPGRILLELTGLGREWDRAGRFLLGIPLALSVVPVLLNPVWHVTNGRWPLLAALAAMNLGGLLACGKRRARPDSESLPDSKPLDAAPCRRTWVLAGAIAILVMVATVGPYWPSAGRHGPVPSSIHDFVKHHAVLFSMQHRPLPLGNPFYADEADGPTYYYHFFYLVPATVRAIAGGPSIELAFGVQSALVALATIGLFYLVAWQIHGPGPATLAAVLASFVGGLDVIPVLLLRLRVITLDAWADHLTRIHSFLNQMMWSPQNILGVTVLLLGVYVWSARGWWRGWLGLGPILIAALLGTSVWVAMSALLGLLIFAASELAKVRHNHLAWWPRLRGLVLVACLALMITLPTIHGYIEMSHRHGKGLTAAWPHPWHALLGRLVPPGPVANLLDLPWVLVVELGPLVLLPAALCGAAWRRSLRDPGLRLLVTSALVALAGYVTVRSHFQYNDFGQKTMLVAMSAGVLLACAVVGPRYSRPRPWNPLGWQFDGLRPAFQRPLARIGLGAMLVLGLPVALLEVPLTATRRFVEPEGRFGSIAPDRAEIHRREADSYQCLHEALPPGAVVQSYWGAQRVDLLQIVGRQLGVMELEADTMVFHPAQATRHAMALNDVSRAFAPGTDGPTARQLLARHHITHVFVGQEERDRFGAMLQLQDKQEFTPLYVDAAASVYALNSPGRE